MGSIAVRALLVIVLVAPTSLAGCSSSNPIPGPLVDIEEKSEDIIDSAPAGRWEEVDADVRSIRSAWSKYEPPEAVQAGLTRALEDSIDTLEAAVGTRTADETRQAANDVSAALFNIWERYSPATPIQISRLDVIGRQVILDVERGDLDGARTQVELGRRTFDVLREDAALSDAEELVGKIDGSFDALTQELDASDAAAVVQQANVFLELIDDLERLF